jgi:transcriptional regulator with XRE-family HTH domain
MAEHVSLKDETRRLLKESKKTLPQIYKETGISYYWLRKFKSGEVAEPGVNRIQALYEYLVGDTLFASEPADEQLAASS